jgi:hypothetical protein
MTTFPNPFNVFPGAGGNWQEIMTRWWSPNISLNFAGDAGIEREVNEDVASYGRQIGWLNDIVAALAAEKNQRYQKAARDRRGRQGVRRVERARQRRLPASVAFARSRTAAGCRLTWRSAHCWISRRSGRRAAP